MKRYFERYETLISIILIIIYVVVNSFCIQFFGMTDYRTTILNFILSIGIVIFIIKNKLGEYYGLTKLPKFKEFLYFIPLILIVFVNFIGGINIKNTFLEIIFYMLSMCFVGFLEEVIFRGFLFKMMEKDNLNRAIIVSSLTFGIGHIVNLLNGAEFIDTMIQILYSVTVGYMFVIIFYKGKSLWPCIITHALINAFSIFMVNNIISLYIAPIFLVIISILYSKYLIKKVNG